MKILDYLFFRIYRFYKKKRDATPVFMGCAVITILTTFNCYDLIVIISLLKKETLNIPKYLVWIFMIIPMLFCLVRYKDNKTIKKIEDQYSKFSSRYHKKRDYFIVIYIILTFLIPLLYAYLKHNVGMDI